MIKRIKKFFGIRKIVKAAYFDEIMHLEYSDGSHEEYKGECTVWHKLPTMERAGTMKEGRLCELWEYVNYYGNPYPIAHKKNIAEILIREADNMRKLSMENDRQILNSLKQP